MDPRSDSITRAQLDRDYDAAVEQVLAANPGVPGTLIGIEGTAYYDPDTGLCIFTFGPPAPCTILELDDTLWFRLDPETDRLLGLEIPSVAAFEEMHPDLAGRVQSLVECGLHAPRTFVPVSPRISDELATDLGVLLRAA